MTTITGKEAFEFADELEAAWNNLQAAAGTIAEMAEKIEGINDALCEDTKRRDSIRESEKLVYRGIYDIQAEAWVLIMNIYASFGLDSMIPDGEGKRRWEHDQRQAKRIKQWEKQIAGNVVVELTAEQLKRGIEGGQF